MNFACRRAIAYLSIFVFLFQANVATLTIATIGVASIFPSKSFAQPPSDTPLLDELKAKHNIDDPYRNHSNTDTIYHTLGQPIIDPTRNLTNLLGPNSEVTTTITLPNTSMTGLPPEQLMSQFEGQALGIGLSNTTPTMDANSNLDIKYAKKGTRIFTRDAAGNLVMGITSDEPEYVTGITKEDYLGSAINRSDVTFTADSAYGDDTALITEGQNTRADLATGSHDAARAYQMVTEIADIGLNTTIDPTDPLLDPSRQAYADAQDPANGFFSACTETTEIREEDVHYPVYEDKQCQRNIANNLDYCEVERKLRIPLVVGGSGFSSCGVGCYELNLGGPGDNYYTPNCGSKCGSAIFTESRTVELNLADGFSLNSVSASANFDDHFELLVNGNLAFSQINGVFSYNNRIPTPPPNAGRGFAERGNDSMSRNVTFGVNRHIVPNVKTTYTFATNTLVGGEGEMDMTIQFRFTDLTGEGFGEIITQTPAGCYDAVSNKNPQGVGQPPFPGPGPGPGFPGFPGPIVPVLPNVSPSSIAQDSGDPEPRIPPEDDEPPIDIPGDPPDEPPIDWVGIVGNDLGSCRFDEYEVLEEGTRSYPQEYLNFLGPFFPGDTGNKTWKMNLKNYRCDPLGGRDYCVINAETGLETCYTWEDLRDAPNECAVYEQDPACNLVSSTCSDGWTVEIDGTEYCFNETRDFRCDIGTTITREVERVSNSCIGAVPCAGGDCEFGETESNTRFVEAAVQSSVLQSVDGDMACTDPADPSTCTIFKGEAEYCSWELTGLGMDCCEEPGGIDIFAYVATAQMMLKTNRMAADGLFGETAQGAANSLVDFADGAYTTISDTISTGWNTVADPVSKALSPLTDNITSAYNSLVGNATNTIVDSAGTTVAETAAGASEGLISSALATLQQEAYKLVYDMLPDELANLLFDQVVDQAGQQTGELVINETISNVFGNIMFAYQVYSLAKLALTLLTMCDENEADMGIKLGQRQCFKVGNKYCSKDFLGICYQRRQDHCCYNSILARIIMEQAGPLLSIDTSNCEGLTQAQLATLDFDQIDLSEWVGLMIGSGEIKETANEQELTGPGTLVQSRCETYMERDPQTGLMVQKQNCFNELEGGRELNTYGRQNVSDRTVDRLQDGQVFSDGATRTLVDFANNLDCSVTPRPKVCDYSFDIRDDSSN